MKSYKKIVTKHGIVYKKVDNYKLERAAEQKEINESNAYENPDSLLSDKSESEGRADVERITPDTLLTKKQRKMVEEAIARQDRQLASGNYSVVERQTNNGVALSMKSNNLFDVGNYNEDTIYRDLNGRYKNIFSHMNMLWCDNHGFEDCSKCSMYARMLVEVFDKINELSGRDMSKDLCTYNKNEK
tara:strand:- start:4393 stop:4953 length:561 start_codon:yes stop_codon:yes gene_type:complete